MSSGYDFADEDPFAGYKHRGPRLGCKDVACPKCQAAPGEICRRKPHKWQPTSPTMFHAERAEARDVEYRRIVTERAVP